MPPAAAGASAGAGAGADGGVDNGGGLAAPPLEPLLPPAPVAVWPASLQPVKAINASTTNAMLDNARTRDMDGAPPMCGLSWALKAGAMPALGERTK
jgi:hypothetical protein